MIHNKKNRKYFLGILAATLLLGSRYVVAGVLVPGAPVVTCGEVADVGVYTLAANISTTTGPCLIVTSGGAVGSTTINGAGFTITGSINADGTNPGDPGHNFTLQNSTVVGTTSSNGEDDDGSCNQSGGNGGSIILQNASTTRIVANGGNDLSGCYGSGYGGSITFTNSTTTSIVVNAGSNINSGSGGVQAGFGGIITIASSSVPTLLSANGGSDTVGADGGNGGTISISAAAENLSTTTISAAAGLGAVGQGFSNGNAGTLTLSFASLITSTTTIFNNVSLTANNIFLGLINGVFNPFPLSGGGITDARECSIINSPGTYHLAQNLTGDCNVTSNGVIINGAGFTINGNVNASGTIPDDLTFNFTLENATVTGTTSVSGNVTILNATTSAISTNAISGSSVSGNAGSITITNSTTTSISANANTHGPHCGLCTPNSAAAGTITITNSTTGPISANSPLGAGSVGGNITISAGNLNLSSTTISATGSTNGTLTLNYNVLTSSNVTLSALSNIILNGPGNLPGSQGSFGGGAFLLTNTISNSAQCSLGRAGTYFLANSITGDCHVMAEGIVIDGAGYTINGNVIGDATQTGNSGFDFTLKNVTVTGTTTSNGSFLSSFVSNFIKAGSGGTITILNSTTSAIYSNAASCLNSLGVTCGSGGSVILQNSTTTSITVNGGNNHTVFNNNGIPGNAGTIVISTSSTGFLVANGGNGDTKGGNGGSITITHSSEMFASTTITANGGNATSCGYGGNGGSVVLIGSVYTGAILTQPGANQTAYGSGLCNETVYGYSSSGGPAGSSGTPGTTQIQIPSTPSVTPVSEPAAAPVTSVQAPTVFSSGGFSSIPLSTSTALTINSATNTPVAIPQKSFAAITSDVIAKVGQTADAIISSPVSKTVQTVGIFGGLLASVAAYSETIFTTPLAASESLLIPVRLWGLMLVGLGIRKRARRWGTVYDSVTKQPIDPAFVTAKDINGNVVAQSITDIDGRYGFLLPDGIYYLSAQKTNYEFPSKKIEGKVSDELYNDLYFGGPVVIRSGEVLDRNIPMDQKNFDWNEAVKKERHDLLFHTRHEKVWAITSNYIYSIGFIISVIATAFHPHWFNIVILALYIFILLPLEFRFKRKKLGHVTDAATHEPLSYAIIRVTAFDHQTVLRTGVCDVQGRYYCIIPKGRCFVDIEKKNPDGSYTKVYESQMIVNKSGIINSDFVV